MRKIIDEVQVDQTMLNQFSIMTSKKVDEQKYRDNISEEIREINWLNKLQNYPQELKTFIEENLTCSICMSIFDEPYEFSCKHRYCKICVLEMNNSKQRYNYLKCPQCNAVQSRDFELFKGKSFYTDILEYFIRELPIICFKCESKKQRQSKEFEEPKTNSQLSTWQGSLSQLEDHILYCHSTFKNFNNLRDSLPCIGLRYGCTKNFKTNISQIIHQSTECQFQWRRCFHCLQIHFGKYLKNHECKGGNLSDMTKIQVEFGKPYTTVHQLLIIVDSEEEVVIQKFFINDLMKSLQDLFIFTIDESHVHETSRLLNFQNTFLAENFISALNNKEIHRSINITVLRYDDSFQEKQPVKQLEKSQLFNPGDYQWEDDERTVFFYSVANTDILEYVEMIHSTISYKIFGRGKSNRAFCGTILCQNEESANHLVTIKKMYYMGTQIKFCKYVRR